MVPLKATVRILTKAATDDQQPHPTQHLALNTPQRQVSNRPRLRRSELLGQNLRPVFGKKPLCLNNQAGLVRLHYPALGWRPISVSTLETDFRLNTPKQYSPT